MLFWRLEVKCLKQRESFFLTCTKALMGERPLTPTGAGPIQPSVEVTAVLLRGPPQKQDEGQLQGCNQPLMASGTLPGPLKKGDRTHTAQEATKCRQILYSWRGVHTDVRKGWEAVLQQHTGQPRSQKPSSSAPQDESHHLPGLRRAGQPNRGDQVHPSPCKNQVEKWPWKTLDFPESGSQCHDSSVTQSCPTLCDPMDCSTPGFPVHHQLPGSAQTHVH